MATAARAKERMAKIVGTCILMVVCVNIRRYIGTASRKLGMEVSEGVVAVEGYFDDGMKFFPVGTTCPL